MPNELLGLLLSAATMLLYWADRKMAKPVITICRCGDLVQHVPGWPTRCPSCKGLII
ncbi:MAG TPA: hypothetical protein VFU22_09350 [Roseiflexaceae bacterium]|nr:hypothetical protein [Roseiflexaceae bacterium]